MLNLDSHNGERGLAGAERPPYHALERPHPAYLSRHAVHRTIVVVDIEGFGDARRTNVHQLVVREALYRLLEQAFRRARISWSGCYREDRGDGVLLLAPPEIPKDLFVETLPAALITGLSEHNRGHRPEERIRLRIGLHAGEGCYDDHGVTAAAITLAFRLVNARPCKVALAGSAGMLVVIASNWFFEEVVRNSIVGDV